MVIVVGELSHQFSSFYLKQGILQLTSNSFSGSSSPAKMSTVGFCTAVQSAPVTVAVKHKIRQTGLELTESSRCKHRHI